MVPVTSATTVTTGTVVDRTADRIDDPTADDLGGARAVMLD